MSRLTEEELTQLYDYTTVGDHIGALVFLYCLAREKNGDGLRWRQWGELTGANAEIDSDVGALAIDDLKQLNPRAFLIALDDAVYFESSQPHETPLPDPTRPGQAVWLVRRAAHKNKTTRERALADSVHFLKRHLILSAQTTFGEQQLKIHITYAPPALNKTLKNALTSAAPFAALSNFNPLAHLNIETRTVGSQHYIRVTAKEEQREETLKRIVGWFDASPAAAFFMIPECTLPKSWRDEFAASISRREDPQSPALSLLGSFHETTDGAKCENRCDLIDRRGKLVISSHQKTAAAVEAIDKIEHVEDISLGDTLHLLATDVGLIGIAICLEFFQSGCQSAAWQALAPDWMLVPTMGGKNTTDAHETIAERLNVWHHTTTLVCNQRFGEDCIETDCFVVLSESHKNDAGKQSSRTGTRHAKNGRVTLNPL